MVLNSLQSILNLIIALSASFAAIMGIVVLEAFFRNKLKNLFDDNNYFIFFFMVAGYFLYALGEVSYYLSRRVFNDVSSIGIQDVYWTGGALLIFISFVALAFTLFKEHGSSKLGILLIVSLALVGLVSAIVLGYIGTRSEYFFGSFYPIISSLIVGSSFSVILFMKELGGMSKPLLLFFLASSCILLGDIFFNYSSGEAAYGNVSLLTDIAYLWGYSLSWMAFISLKLHLHRSVQRR